MTKQEQLKHLEGAIPQDAWDYTISSYCVILEAWRRGLTVTFVNENRRKSELTYIISNKDKQHTFSVARGDLVPREAVLMCVNKNNTKKALIKNNVSTPLGKVFRADSSKENYLNYAEEIDFPLVVKPVNGTGGKGVITGIENKEALISSILYLKEELDVKDIIIEQYIEGTDYRLYVLNNKVIAAYTRERAHVIGDGKSSIYQLVYEKNKERSTKSPLGGNSKIKLDQESEELLKKKNYTFESIPTKEEKVYLNTKNNVSSGGEATDVTDNLNDKMKQIAVDAANAIPGLVQGGVDMIIDDKQEHGYVLEVNSRPHIRSHLFPINGTSRDVPKVIIDYYFPETKGKIENILYYDFAIVYRAFQEGICSRFTLPNYPEGDLVLKRYEVTHIKNKLGFASFCRKTARKHNLSGYIKGIGIEKGSLVLAGTTESIEVFINALTSHFNLISLSEQLRNSPVRIGFTSINMSNKKMNNSNSNASSKNQSSPKVVMSNPNDPNIEGYFPIVIANSHIKPSTTLKGKSKDKSKPKKINRKQKDNKNYYQSEYEKVINSTSWKVTKPLRSISKMFFKK